MRGPFSHLSDGSTCVKTNSLRPLRKKDFRSLWTYTIPYSKKEQLNKSFRPSGVGKNNLSFCAVPFTFLYGFEGWKGIQVRKRPQKIRGPRDGGETLRGSEGKEESGVF